MLTSLPGLTSLLAGLNLSPASEDGGAPPEAADAEVAEEVVEEVEEPLPDNPEAVEEEAVEEKGAEEAAEEPPDDDGVEAAAAEALGEAEDETGEVDPEAAAQKAIRAEAGKAGGWLNQLPAAEKEEIVKDPAGYAAQRRLEKEKAAAYDKFVMSQERPERTEKKTVDQVLDVALEGFFKRYPKLAEANKEFFKDYTRSIGQAIREVTTSEAKEASVEHVTISQINAELGVVKKSKLWNHPKIAGKVQRDFYGEVELNKRKGVWELPLQVFRRIAREYAPAVSTVKKEVAKVVVKPAVQLAERSGSSVPGKVRSVRTDAKTDWVNSPYAKALDKRGGR